MRIQELRCRRQSASVSCLSRPLARHSATKSANSSPSLVRLTPWFFISAWRQGSERNSSAVSASTLPYSPERASRVRAPSSSSSVSSFLFFFSSFSLALSFSSFLLFVSSLRQGGGVSSPRPVGAGAAAWGRVWGANVLHNLMRGCAQSVSRITLSPSVSAPSVTQKRP